jgi:hypothetical protein
MACAKVKIRFEKQSLWCVSVSVDNNGIRMNPGGLR